MKVNKIYQKGSGPINEDQLLIKGNLFAVFDGIRGLFPYHDREGKTGGQIVSGIAKKIFAKNRGTLADLARNANEEIRVAMKKANIDLKCKEALWGTHVAAVRIYKSYFEFFNIGDCLILAVFQSGDTKLIVPFHDHDTQTLVAWKKLAQQGVDNLWERIRPRSIQLRKGMNRWYGVLNGDRAAEKFFRHGRYPLRGIKSLILFTDGIHIPKEDPEAAEDWTTFAKRYYVAGLRGLTQFVRTMEKRDPLCWKYPRFKKHDDIAAIGIDFV